ncbi:MAG: hypothetical protein R2710_27270 [Acidimicrobiales bacterium]
MIKLEDVTKEYPGSTVALRARRPTSPRASSSSWSARPARASRPSSVW